MQRLPLCATDVFPRRRHLHISQLSRSFISQFPKKKNQSIFIENGLSALEWMEIFQFKLTTSFDWGVGALTWSSSFGVGIISCPSNCVALRPFTRWNKFYLNHLNFVNCKLIPAVKNETESINFENIHKSQTRPISWKRSTFISEECDASVNDPTCRCHSNVKYHPAAPKSDYAPKWRRQPLRNSCRLSKEIVCWPTMFLFLAHRWIIRIPLKCDDSIQRQSHPIKEVDCIRLTKSSIGQS
jgi:hypothetical protein